MLASEIGGKASVLRSEWHGLLSGLVEMVNTETVLRATRSAVNASLLVSQLGLAISSTGGLDVLIKGIDANG